LPRTPPKNPKSALIIKLGHIGDVLVTTPVITALKRQWPGVEISMVVNQGTEAMVRYNPMVDNLVVIRRDIKGKLAELSFQAGMIKNLRRRRFELSLELSAGDRGAFLSLISGSGFRVGFEPIKPHVRGRAFNLTVSREGTKTHVIKTFLRQVRALGFEPGEPPMRFYPGQEAENQAKEILADRALKPGGYALVHPTSRWMFKTWTPEKMARATGHLVEKGLAIVLSAAPIKVEQDYITEMKKNLDPAWPVHDLSGSMDLYLLGALIKNAKLHLGVDSAPMHMAAALGTPVVVPFGPSGEKMWGPWKVEHEVVTQKDCDCRPCGRDGCDGSKISRCLTELPLGDMTGAIDRLLARI
jgi:heptosyltransferase-3